MPRCLIGTVVGRTVHEQYREHVRRVGPGAAGWPTPPSRATAPARGRADLHSPNLGSPLLPDADMQRPRRPSGAAPGPWHCWRSGHFLLTRITTRLMTGSVVRLPR